MDQVDIVIIGAGVVGLAVGYELSCKFPGREIVLFERNQRFGQEISSRNSEVIHAGIYYPAVSLKAKLCREGNLLLYRFCEKYGVRHKRIGKLIVALSDDDLIILEKLHRQGLGNGLELGCLDAELVRQWEPAIRSRGALFSPMTGIIDAEHYMRQLSQLLTANGVMAVYQCEVTGIEPVPEGYRIETIQGDRLATKVVINAAGLNSDRVAELAGINLDRFKYRIYYCKGEYFRVIRPIAINRLVYPPPEHAGLGIHITQDLNGAQRLGPSAYYVKGIDYGIDWSAQDYFYEAARAYLPELKKEEIQPDFAGIRPKLQGPADSFRDFVITDEKEQGLPGLVNLIGIESPGLTSSLAIGNYIGEMISGYLR